MSLLDQVRKLEQQVADRLRELEPLIREYGQLRKLAERLGIKYTPLAPETAEAEAAPPAKRPATKRAAKRAPARKPAAKRASKPRAAKATAARRGAAVRPSQRQDDVLRLVAEQPGITVREIGERLGVDPTGLYRVVKRLSDDGRVRKNGPALHPAQHAPSAADETLAGSTPPTAGAAETETPSAGSAPSPAAEESAASRS